MTLPQTNIPTEIGGYRPDRLIGVGGQAEVYALAGGGGELPFPCALKWSRQPFDPPADDPLAEEYRLSAALQHPQLVPALDFGYFRKRAFLVSKLIAGPQLFDGLQRANEVSLWRLIEAVAPVLAFLHQRGIIHRDLKPENFRWSSPADSSATATGHRRLYLLDLGLVSRARDPAHEGRSGTLHYMAPEVLREGRVDARSDLYSLGIILYQWLTGSPPFDAEDPAEVIDGHLTGQINWPTDLQVEVGQQTKLVIEKLLAKNPEGRPADIAELLGLFAGCGMPVDQSFPETQNIEWHRLTTRRLPPLMATEIDFYAKSPAKSSWWVCGDGGNGQQQLAFYLSHELKIAGWSVKLQENYLQATTGSPDAESFQLKITNDPVNSPVENQSPVIHRCLTLLPLDGSAIAEYLRSIFPDDNFVQSILSVVIRLSSGLPEAVDLLLGEWIDAEVITFQDGAWTAVKTRLDEVLSSDRLRRFYSRFTDDLTTSRRRCLELAAVCGSSFSAEVVTRLLKKTNLPSELLDELKTQGIFVGCAPTGESLQDLRFRLSGLAEIWVADLPPQHHSELAGLVAEVLQEIGERWGETLPRHLALQLWTAKKFRQAAEAALSWAGVNANPEGAQQAHRFLDLAQRAVNEMPPLSPTDKLPERIVLLRGRVYQASGELDQARQCYRLVLALTRKTGGLHRQAEAAKYLGDIYKSTRDHQKGRRILRYALRNFRRLGDEAEVSRTLNNLGNIAFICLQIDVALDYYQQALSIQQRLGLTAEVASTLSNIGSIHIHRYDFTRGQESLRESLRLKEKLKRPGEVGRTLNNLGVVGVLAGQYADAAGYFSRAAKINQSIGALDEWLLCRTNFLETLNWLGRYRQTITEAPELLAQSEKFNEGIHCAFIQECLARAYFAIADYKSAWTAHLQTDALLLQVDDPTLTVRHLLFQVDWQLQFTNREACGGALLKALRYAEESGDPRERGEVYLAAARATRQLGELAPEFFAADEEARRIFDEYAGEHRIFELLLVIDDPSLAVFLSKYPLPANFAEVAVLQYSGPPAQEGLWLWRLAGKAIVDEKRELAGRLLAELIGWCDKYGVAELSWRAHNELGILYHRALDWEMAANSFATAVRILEEIAATITEPTLREKYLSGVEVRRLYDQLAAFSARFAR